MLKRMGERGTRRKPQADKGRKVLVKIKQIAARDPNHQPGFGETEGDPKL